MRSAFLLRPTPYAGESLSSWRHRAYRANGYWSVPLTLFKYQRDPDILPSPPDLLALSEMFGISDGLLRSLDIDPLLRAMLKPHYKSSYTRWLLPRLGNLVGPRFCPLCLLEDNDAFFRASWRWAFVTRCERHACLLQNCCTQCHALVWPVCCILPHSQITWRGDLRRCMRCNELLTSTLPNATLGNTEVIAGRSLWGALSSDKVPELTGQCTNACELLNAMWLLCQILLKHGSSYQAASLRKHTKRMQIQVERLRPEDAESVIEVAFASLQNWPDGFVKLCKREDLKLSSFETTRLRYPSWFEHTIHTQLSRSNKSKSSSQVAPQLMS